MALTPDIFRCEYMPVATQWTGSGNWCSCAASFLALRLLYLHLDGALPLLADGASCVSVFAFFDALPSKRGTTTCSRTYLVEAIRCRISRNSVVFHKHTSSQSCEHVPSGKVAI